MKHLKKYFFIAAGGFSGAVLRYISTRIHIPWHIGSIPLNVLFINVSGSFLMLLLLSIPFLSQEENRDLKLCLTTGFLGAYTTFSTLCKESSNLLSTKQYIPFLIYTASSIILGLVSAYAGNLLGKKIFLRKESPGGR